MSSIYDALQRIQQEKEAWPAPVREEKPPAKRKMLWIVALALAVGSLCVAGVFVGVKIIGQGGQGSPAASLSTDAGGSPQTSPSVAAAVAGQDMAGTASAGGTDAPVQPSQTETLDSYLRTGEKYYAAKDYDKALLTFTKALHYFRKDARLLNNIGGVYLAMDQPEKAIHYLKESIDATKDNVEPVYNLACAYSKLGDKASAISHLNKACSMNPDARAWAAQDADLQALKGMKDFDRLTGAHIVGKGE